MKLKKHYEGCSMVKPSNLSQKVYRVPPKAPEGAEYYLVLTRSWLQNCLNVSCIILYMFVLEDFGKQTSVVIRVDESHFSNPNVCVSLL